MPRRPLVLSALGAVQFAAFGIACVVLLGEGTEDGALSGGDIGRAIGVALLGAVVVGSTWSGGRVAWWFELLLAFATIGCGAATGAADDLPGWPLAALGAVWLGVVVLPQSRTWYLRPLE